MGLCFLSKFPVSFLRPLVPHHIHIGIPAAAMKTDLPDGWTEYVPVGKRIPGTRFIAFKVPLKKNYDNKLTPCQRFSPTDLITEIEKQNETLGLIVDLTCTKRYYFPEELPKTIKYHKIFTAGQQIPNNKVYHEFRSVVNRYLSENSGNNNLVGVHCTHGLNRTGYLVCRYLIDVIGMEPSEAIEKFNKSRGHCMERENYLDDLLHCNTRNNAGINQPSLPQYSHPHHDPRRNFHSAPRWWPPQWHGEQPWFNGGGHSRPNHHRNRHFSPQGGATWAQVSDSSFSQQNGVNSGNSAPVQAFPQRFTGKQGTAARASGPQHRGQGCPYQR
ncbi:RNA/RNP complex-1-interacting phosphatase isoform X2 [Pseudophryne corroboree]|uniref:RNA/RNP complex-1-interacting phosphatase isoform X2 n=1 Tax=Pseudophryne corroboree TaxID=495146 RepID=UPI0030818D7E